MTLVAAAMKTFEEAFCEQHRCTPAQFRDRVFWTALHRHSLPLAWVLRIVDRDQFEADFDLIAGCARATTFNRIRGEIDEHYSHPMNRGLWRDVFMVRVSVRRLKRIARQYVPERPITHSPFKGGV